SVSFQINRVSGGGFLNGLGATSVTNPSIADNNSPLPQDRVSYRYNLYHDALQVSGFAGLSPTFDVLNGTFHAIPALRQYDVNQSTFAFEKTFLDQRFSLEMRFPFTTTLGSSQNLSYGTITGIRPARDFNPITGAAEPLVPDGFRITEVGQAFDV